VKVLVLGGGGREHALAWKLAQSPSVTALLVAPGNPGIESVATCVAVEPTKPADVVALAKARGVELVVVGPEAPLVAGVADALRAEGIDVFGPGAGAAAIEGSKAFAKEIMLAAGVPTGRSETVTSVDEGMAAVAEFGLPVAVKADGLAAGKGVVIAQSDAEARAALESMLDDGVFGDAGRTVVVEEGLTGPEVSLLAISDGTAVARFPAARDYKPIGEGNTGPNTGGMGSVSPVPDIPDHLADQLVDEVHRPVIAEMARRGMPFSGVLYAGIMMTPGGPKVLEFNVRFGDPETQALLPRVDVDLGEVLLAAAAGGLADRPVSVAPGASVAVVLAAANYPGDPRSGDVITGIADAQATGAEVFQAGTALNAAGDLVTNGGRVLAVQALGDDVEQARGRAYAAAELIRFDGMQMRRDIAAGMDG
jgi:phosphoribosylamine---glycine ligase